MIGTGPVRDRFGWRELRLQSLAKDEGGRALTSSRRSPATRRSATSSASSAGRRCRSRSVGAGVPRLCLGSWLRPWRRFYVAAHRRISSCLPLAGAAFAVALLAVIAARWLAWQRTGYAVDGDRLLVRTGWWRRRIAVLPARKIQSVDFAKASSADCSASRPCSSASPAQRHDRPFHPRNPQGGGAQIARPPARLRNMTFRAWGGAVGWAGSHGAGAARASRD